MDAMLVSSTSSNSSSSGSDMELDYPRGRRDRGMYSPRSPSPPGTPTKSPPAAITPPAPSTPTAPPAPSTDPIHVHESSSDTDSDIMEIPYPPIRPAYDRTSIASMTAQTSPPPSVCAALAESAPESETEVRHLSLATQYELRDPLFVASSSATTTATSSETDDAIIKSLQKSRKRLRKKGVTKTSKAA